MSQIMKIQRSFGWLNALSCSLVLLCNIEYTGGIIDCEAMSSCKSETMMNRNCMCISQCHIFDECCVDAPGLNTTLLAYNVTEIQRAQTCETSFNDYPVYVVNRCPKEADELMKQRCISNTTDDVLTSVPVSGVETGLVFRNVYCAFCHGAMLSEILLFWNIAIDCQEPSGSGAEPDEVEALSLTYALSLTDTDSCRRNYIPPERLPSPRQCPIMIDHCSPGWTDEIVAKKCSSYNNYTYFKEQGASEITYKNSHCAMCNYVNESQLSCITFGGSWQKGPPSMRLLLDINRGQLTRLEESGYFEGELTKTGEGSLQKCPDNNVLDIFQGVCRPVFCEDGANYVDENKECLHDLNGSSRDNVSLAYNLTCVLTRLNDSEYKEYENGTVHVVARDLILHTGEYVPSQNGSGIAICAHYLSRRTATYTDTVEMYLVESYLTTAGYLLSLSGLLTLFTLYMLLPELRNLPGKCLMNLVAALFLAQLLFLLINIPRPNSTICKILSTAAHFLYLAAFFWMNVLGFDIWRTFQFQSLSHSTHENVKKIIFYHVYAWGMPLLVVSAAVLVDEVLPVSDDIRPQYGDNFCWFNTKWGLLYFFAVPVALLLTANIIFFILSAYNICRTSCASSLVSSSLSKKRHLLLNIKLSAIMGLTWTLGFLAIVLPEYSALWNAFVISGSLQGVVICLGFACNQKTFRLLKLRRNKKKKTSSSAKVSTDSTRH